MPLAQQEHTTVAALDAPSRFPELLTQVEEGNEITITEGGRPVARLVPFASPATRKSGFGCMAGTFEITGDIISPEPDVWDAMR